MIEVEKTLDKDDNKQHETRTKVSYYSWESCIMPMNEWTR